MHALRHRLAGLVLATAFAAGPAAAAVVTFDAPGLIDIDPVTNVATYREAGFRVAGDAATFLPLDGIGRDGSGGLFVVGADTVIRLAADGGAPFTLLGLEAGLFDLLSSGELTIEGLGAGAPLLQTIDLGALQTAVFDGWSGLSEVRFSASVDFVLDNLAAVAAVPEPAALLLVLAGLAALTGLRSAPRRRAAV